MSQIWSLLPHNLIWAKEGEAALNLGKKVDQGTGVHVLLVGNENTQMTAKKEGTNKSVHRKVIIRGEIIILKSNPVTGKINQDLESGIDLTGVILMIRIDKTVMTKDDKDITIMKSRHLEV